MRKNILILTFILMTFLFVGCDSKEDTYEKSYSENELINLENVAEKNNFNISKNIDNEDRMFYDPNDTSVIILGSDNSYIRERYYKTDSIDRVIETFAVFSRENSAVKELKIVSNSGFVINKFEINKENPMLIDVDLGCKDLYDYELSFRYVLENGIESGECFTLYKNNYYCGWGFHNGNIIKIEIHDLMVKENIITEHEKFWWWQVYLKHVEDTKEFRDEFGIKEEDISRIR